MAELMWQLHDHNEWRFGPMVRGVVRRPYYAEIYYDEDQNPSWIWFTHFPGKYNSPRGAEYCFSAALNEAEDVLRKEGILHEIGDPCQPAQDQGEPKE